MDATYGGTTTASDWGERDELLDRLRQIAALAKTLPHGWTASGSAAVTIGLGIDSALVERLIAMGGHRRANLCDGGLGGVAIDGVTLICDGIEVRAQADGRAMTDEERAEYEARSKA